MVIIWNEPALDHLLNDPAGDVGRHMLKIGVKILAGAKRKAGRRTGDLHRQMYVRQGRRPLYQYVEVGSTSRHAYLHHEGARPHAILPENGRFLRFNVGGRTVYARRVAHPGAPGNPYLTTPMRRVVAGR